MTLRLLMSPNARRFVEGVLLFKSVFPFKLVLLSEFSFCNEICDAPNAGTVLM